ncbi:MAG: ADP-ribosylglycohydrolase family protein [Planctomycetes bacterium]|nr:ADP-ribosylglycohydrolase family protein [Planctomycetota bacterium]
MTQLSDDPDARRQRARITLDGLSIGDAFGERFFAREAADLLAQRSLPPAPWRYTDDTEMALGLYECLVRFGQIKQNDLAAIFAQRYDRDPWKGYGGTVRGVLRGIHDGIPWRMLAKAAYGGEGSMGNGSAMRVGVLGAWFADDLERVVHEAHLSAEVTHAHADGIAGAIAVAVATALIWRMPNFDAAAFFSTILDLTPAGATRDHIARARDLPVTYTIRTAAVALGNGNNVVCSDTIPLCLWLVARHPGDYVEALWSAVTAEGDRDTTCAIIGGMLGSWGQVAAFPIDWLHQREPLDLAANLAP